MKINAINYTNHSNHIKSFQSFGRKPKILKNLTPDKLEIYNTLTAKLSEIEGKLQEIYLACEANLFDDFSAVLKKIKALENQRNYTLAQLNDLKKIAKTRNSK